MRKIVLLILVFVIGFSLVGCDIYADKTKKDMELISVKVYDKDNNEVIGTYKNYRTTIRTEINLIPVNSAAPVENYYFVEAKENELYTVKFTFHSIKGYELSKLVLNNNAENKYSENKIECTDIEKVDNDYVVTLVVEKVEKENQLYQTIKWFKGKTEYTFSTMGSNTYIKGVYFILPTNENTSC